MKGRGRAGTAEIAVAWVCAALTLAGVGLVGWISGLPGAATSEHVGVPTAALAAAWALTGALLVTARPRNAVGWLLIVIGLLQAHSNAGSAFGGYGVGAASPQWPFADWAAQSASMIYLPSLVLPITVILAVYPDGTLPTRHWRGPVGLVVAGLTIITVVASASQRTYNDIAPGPAPLHVPDGWWATATLLVGGACLVSGALAIWVMTGLRLAHAGSPVRQQLTWYACLVLPGMVAIFTGRVGPLVGLLIPAAIAVGVLRYHMLGIVVSRGLEYGVLTMAVVTVYVAVTALASSTVDSGPVPAVTAAALVAVGLAPARERLQRGVERFVYGERQDPMRAVTSLGNRMATQTELLPATLAGVVAAVRAPDAAVLASDGSVITGRVAEPAEHLPIRVSGAEVGTLVVTWRSPTEPYSDSDRRLLASLAPQVAVVVRAVDLAEALEAERDRVLATVRTERDRYRGDLHDELGPSLSGVGLSLQVACDALDVGDTMTARRMIEAARAETGRSVGEVRRIIDDLRPGALDDVGLAEAVRRHARTISPACTVRVDARAIPSLPPTAEAAAYRIVREALTNAVRHADAHHIHVELGTDTDVLVVRVADDGRGMDTRATDTGHVSEGVGLNSMRRRAAALGGDLSVTDAAPGTVITARLPLGEGG